MSPFIAAGPEAMVGDNPSRDAKYPSKHTRSDKPSRGIGSVTTTKPITVLKPIRPVTTTRITTRSITTNRMGFGEGPGDDGSPGRFGRMGLAWVDQPQ